MKKLLVLTSVIAIISGIAMFGGGIWGIVFTYQSVAQEGITTPKDASIPEAPVRGPMTLKAQADIIRIHALNSGKGLTYAQMPGQIPQIDADGKPLLDKDGKPLTMANPARTTWITATALTAALNLGILTYAFSALSAFLGLSFVWGGIISYALSKRMD